jgi:MoCo/4Fe-4S cofactor protein with predicted Tat translocation signal
MLPPQDGTPPEGGQRLWRSLDAWADPATAQAWTGQEFPAAAHFLNPPLERRHLLKLMGAALLLGGCGRAPREEIVPHVHEPEWAVPGGPLHYATSLNHAGYAQGVLVESHEGRPTKIEGNPRHPASLGATDIYAQAAILDLYDPGRAQAVRHHGEPSSLAEFAYALAWHRAEWKLRRGAGLCLLTGTVTSPTLAAQLDEWQRRYPEARWFQHEPAHRDAPLAGARLALGHTADTLYRLERAAVILSLDSDFLTGTPARSRYARDFIDGRNPRFTPDSRSRLYTLESCPNLVGAMADQRWPLRAGQMEAVARALATRLGMAGIPGGEAAPVPEAWLSAVARDLLDHPGAGLVVVGEHLPPVVHALAQAINARLGNLGATVQHIASVAVAPHQNQNRLADLAEAARADEVTALFILDCNPAYTAPADVAFAEAFRRIPFRVHHGLYADETAQLCDWQIPAAHELESWGDARAYDGTASLIQPLIAPLHDGLSAHEFMALLLGIEGQSSYAAVRDYWRAQGNSGEFEAFWRGALRDGLIPGSAFPPLNLKLRPDFAAVLPPPTAPATGIELRFRPEPNLHDGRYANNAWLQELPRPLTKLVWENAVLLGPATARRLGVVHGTRVDMLYQGRRLIGPAWIMPGHAEDSVTLELGYGRAQCGGIGEGLGFSAYRIRTAAAPWFDSGLDIHPAPAPLPKGPLAWLAGHPGPEPLATTQQHGALDGRDLVKVVKAGLAPSAAPAEMPAASLHPAYPYPGHAWAMVIDLDACIGCNACVLACQAENNIPVVGKAEVLRGREMHWLRIDRYYEGPPENPATYFQPVPCMHCEQAPCEPVCPVQASIHDAEGLNNQVYNRCVGTRFCQSNCPYKVRRFNFFAYSDRPDTREAAPLRAALRNPDVSVRSRGVMEKCTYCVQRINAARIPAELEGRELRDGEIQTACQQACPTRAIVFGDQNLAGSAVAALKREPRHYALLGELGTKPRTTYLARRRNPHPELDDAPKA